MGSAKQGKYKQRLVKLRERLTHNVDSAIESLREDVSAPGDISTLPTHPADEASEGLDSQVAIAQNERNLLEMVDGALARIEAGTFGKCADCGEEIEAARLEALPYTPWCVKDAGKHDQPFEPPTAGPGQG